MLSAATGVEGSRGDTFKERAEILRPTGGLGL
jgi:hypothetical protein